MEYACIKTAKMKNGNNKGRWCFSKGKKYMVIRESEIAVMFLDNFGSPHGVPNDYLKEHFALIED